MECVEFGNLKEIELEVVRRDERLYVRYDAGNHYPQWREDEISEAEFTELTLSKDRQIAVLLQIQNRLLATGIDAYASNWKPSDGIA